MLLFNIIGMNGEVLNRIKTVSVRYTDITCLSYDTDHWLTLLQHREQTKNIPILPNLSKLLNSFETVFFNQDNSFQMFWVWVFFASFLFLTIFNLPKMRNIKFCFVFCEN